MVTITRPAPRGPGFLDAEVFERQACCRGAGYCAVDGLSEAAEEAVARMASLPRLRSELLPNRGSERDDPPAATRRFLLARSRTTDVFDAAVIVAANEHNAAVLTSDPKDLAKLASAAEPCPHAHCLNAQRSTRPVNNRSVSDV